MKRAIAGSEIRKGDILCWEGRMDGVHQSRRFTALYDSHMATWDSSGRFYLLDRPAPAVELPTEPTLGWIESTFDAGDLDFWRRRDADDRGGEGAWAGNDANGKPRGYSIGLITAFTPATAVPTAALNVLRDWGANSPHSRLIGDFLAAVDKAGESA